MNVLALQLDIAWEDKDTNFRKAAELARQAAPPPGSLLVLPEMFATGFSMNVPAIHEGDPSPTLGFLAGLAREHRSAVIGGLVTRGADGRGRNESVTVDPDGRVLARYAKLQPFSLGGETQHYAAGDSVELFEWGTFRIAPFVCYDLRFPEHFRRAADLGAEVLTVIANWPVTRVSHWITLLRARAIENQAYVIGVNRSGRDPRYAYPGSSLIIDPLGEILAQAGEAEGFVRADIDRERVLQWRRDFPALADRRRS